MFNPNPLMLGHQGIISVPSVFPPPEVVSITGIQGRTADGGTGPPNYTSWYNEPGTTTPLAFPSVSVGDTLIVAINSNEPGLITVDGFTKIHDSGDIGSGNLGIRLQIFHRVIDGTEGSMLPIDEPGGFGWAFWGIIYVRMRNVMPASPIVVKSGGQFTSASGSMAVPSLDISSASTVPVLFSGIRDEDNVQLISGSDWTKRAEGRYQNGNLGRNGQIMAATRDGHVQEVPGPTGAATVSWSHNLNVPNCYSIIAFRSADYEPLPGPPDIDLPFTSEGLLMYLEANDTGSYPGTGTTWFDLTNYGHDALIYGTNQFTTGTPAKFDFRTVSNITDYIKLPHAAAQLTYGPYTLIFWIQPTTEASGRYFHSVHAVENNNHQIMRQTAGTIDSFLGGDGITHADSEHFQLALVRDTNGDGLMYKNTDTPVSTVLSDLSLTDDNGWILNQEQDSIEGGFDPNQCAHAAFMSVLLYNRELSAAEIAAIHSSLKSSYGL